MPLIAAQDTLLPPDGLEWFFIWRADWDLGVVPVFVTRMMPKTRA